MLEDRALNLERLIWTHDIPLCVQWIVSIEVNSETQICEKGVLVSSKAACFDPY
jgi:hypothetical protein